MALMALCLSMLLDKFLHKILHQHLDVLLQVIEITRQMVFFHFYGSAGYRAFCKL